MVKYCKDLPCYVLAYVKFDSYED